MEPSSPSLHSDRDLLFPAKDFSRVDQLLRAQGKITKLMPTGEKTGGGMVRYDVHMEEVSAVFYSPAPADFGRTGVLVVTHEPK